jgi:hypothetical protein
VRQKSPILAKPIPKIGVWVLFVVARWDNYKNDYRYATNSFKY